MDRTSRLTAFLIERFSASELQRLLLLLPGGKQILAELPDPGQGLAEFVHQAVRLLERRGRLDAVFFETLAEQRPAFKNDIRVFESEFLRDPEPAPPPPNRRARIPRDWLWPLLIGGLLLAWGAGRMFYRLVAPHGEPTVAVKVSETLSPREPSPGEADVPVGTSDTPRTSTVEDPQPKGEEPSAPPPDPGSPPTGSSSLDPVLVCFRSGGEPVPADHAFHSGEEIVMETRAPGDGYLAMVNINPAGEASLLFPWSGDDNRVTRGQRIRLPPSGTFAFQDPAGVERVVLLWSPEPLAATSEILALASGVETVSQSEPWGRAFPTRQGVKTLVRKDDVGTDRCSRFRPQGSGAAITLQIELQHLP